MKEEKDSKRKIHPQPFFQEFPCIYIFKKKQVEQDTGIFNCFFKKLDPPIISSKVICISNDFHWVRLH